MATKVTVTLSDGQIAGEVEESQALDLVTHDIADWELSHLVLDADYTDLVEATDHLAFLKDGTPQRY